MGAGIGLIAPGMRQRTQPCGFRILEIEAEGRVGFAGRVRLQPHRLAVGQRYRARIVEAANAAQRAEHVIERAVLLHQDHHVLRIQEASARRRIDCRGPFYRRQQRAQHFCAARQSGGLAEEATACAHGRNYRRCALNPRDGGVAVLPNLAAYALGRTTSAIFEVNCAAVYGFCRNPAGRAPSRRSASSTS